MSSVITLGCCSLGYVSQTEADKIVDLALAKGINHFDVAPLYGEAELRLRPWMKEHRDEIFLACKTRMRTKKESAEDLNRSLDRMGIDYIDLYQFHGLDNLTDLETALSPDGALQTMIAAREEGVIKYIGITSHRPPTIIKALEHFDLDTVLFPLNYILKKYSCPENNYAPIIKLAKKKNVGMIAMKAVAKGPWPVSLADKPRETRPHSTWYEPFAKQTSIDRCIWFALSHGITTIASACDVQLVQKIIDAAERYTKLSLKDQKLLIESAKDLKPLCASNTFYSSNLKCAPPCTLYEKSDDVSVER